MVDLDTLPEPIRVAFASLQRGLANTEDDDLERRKAFLDAATAIYTWDLPRPDQVDLVEILAVGREFGEHFIHDAHEWAIEAARRGAYARANSYDGARGRKQQRRTNGHANAQLDRGGGSHLVTRNAATVKIKNIRWVWRGRLARGKHTMFAGEGGTCKSARITEGMFWPCSDERAPQGYVLIISAEDAADDVLVPRLMAAGADLTRIEFVDGVKDQNGVRKFNLQQDLEALKAKIAEMKAGGKRVELAWMDPVSSYIGKVDSHNNAALRSVLDPITEAAEASDVAIASITHFNKGSADKGLKAVNRVMGSAAFTNAPRAAFAVMRDFDHEHRILVLPLKINIGERPKGLAFRLGGRVVGKDDDGLDVFATNVEWELDPIDNSADEVLAASAPGAKDPSALDEACDFLRNELAAGAVKVTDLEEHAAALAISSRTLRRARIKLEVVAEKVAFDRGWIWRLPEDGQTSPKASTPQNGHLREDLATFEERSQNDPYDPNQTTGRSAQIDECKRLG